MIQVRTPSSSSSQPNIELGLRFPVHVSDPQDFVDRLTAESGDYRMTTDGLFLPDGRKLDARFVPSDGQFAGIFQASCRQVLTPAQQRHLGNYRFNLLMAAPAGSLAAAREVREAITAVMKAGAAGVLIDNGLVAHTANHWLDMVQVGDVSLAPSFCNIVFLTNRLSSHGMHAFGRPDVCIFDDSDDPSENYDVLTQTMDYLSATDVEFTASHIIGSAGEQAYIAVDDPADMIPEHHPVFNPWGRLRLEPIESDDLAFTTTV